MKIILASNSPRRKQLLAKIVKKFEIIPSLAPEVTPAKEPRQYALDLARHKALDVWQQQPQECDVAVIGCDTVVDLNGNILGKPVSAQNAVEMLQMLSDKTHFVHTGVCVICGGKEHCFCESTSVTFRKLSQRDVENYVLSGGAMDKAGAYGIQECDFVCAYSGSYDNVVGFPTERILQLFKSLNIV